MKFYILILTFFGFAFCLKSQTLTINSDSLVEYFNAENNTRKIFVKGDNLPFTGVSVTYDQSSNVVLKNSFVHGELYGESRKYYSSGKLESLINYTDNLLQDGIYSEWYESGQLRIKGQYKRGVKIGTWEYYNSEGEEIKTIEFDDKGNLINTHQNGSIVEIEYLFEEQKAERDSLGIPAAALKISSSIFTNQVIWVYIDEVINSENFVVYVFDENGSKINGSNSRFRVVEGNQKVEDNTILLGVTGFANGSIFLANGLWSPW